MLNSDDMTGSPVHIQSLTAEQSLASLHTSGAGLTAAEAVTLARRSGGAGVLAHPHTVAAGAEEYARALEAFAALGGAGVECHYPGYPAELQAHLAALTRRLGMAPTGGSDYHGGHRPGIALGTGQGDLHVPDAVVVELGRHRGP